MKLLITCLFAISSFGFAYSQNTLNFCGYVDQKGFCFLNNTKYFFTPGNDTLGLFMETVKGTSFTANEKITYKIYTVNNKGEEKYESMVEQTVQAGWMFAWLPHMFTVAGKYNIKVFDEAGALLCSKSLELVGNK